MQYDLEPGNFVVNPSEKEWGIGQVQSIIKNKATINFQNVGKDEKMYPGAKNNKKRFKKLKQQIPMEQKLGNGQPEKHNTWQKNIKLWVEIIFNS